MPVSNNVNNCPICLEPVGETAKETNGSDETSYVTAVLHATPEGVDHLVHRVCVFQWFQEQLDNEPPGKDPNDTDDVPFSCPLCKIKVTTEEAAKASGVEGHFPSMIETTRKFRQNEERLGADTPVLTQNQNGAGECTIM